MLSWCDQENLIIHPNSNYKLCPFLTKCRVWIRFEVLLSLLVETRNQMMQKFEVLLWYCRNIDGLFVILEG